MIDIDVAFTPSEVQALDNKICVVVDVMRATSSLTVIASQKPKKLTLTTTVQKAVMMAEKSRTNPLLCGERRGLPPDGFDYGNSPLEYHSANLKDKEIVFTSGNGTRAIADTVLSPKVYLGCFLNASAVCKKAYETALDKKCDILLVCAGREEKFAIDDAYCAGYLVQKIVSLIPFDKKFVLSDGAQAALGIYGYYKDAKKLFLMSGAGKSLVEIGLESDIDFLLKPDLIDCVPEMIDKNAVKMPEYGFYLAV